MFGECHPPSPFSQEPHALYSLHFTHTHTHKHKRKFTPTHSSHTQSQPSILHIFRNPTTHSFNPTHPLMLPVSSDSNWAGSDFKSSLASTSALEIYWAVYPEVIRVRTYEIVTTFSRRQTFRRTQYLTWEASTLITSDPEQLVELQTQKSKHVPPVGVDVDAGAQPLETGWAAVKVLPTNHVV